MPALCAQRAAGQHILLLLGLEHLRPGNLAHADPFRQQQRHNHQPHALGHEDGQHGDNHQPRDAVGNLHKPLHDAVRHPAEIAGDQAVAHADDHVNNNGDKRDQDADSGAVPGPGPQIPSHVIRAEQEGVFREIPLRRLSGEQLLQRRDLRRNAPRHHALVILIPELDNVPVAEGIHKGAENGQQDDHGDDHQSCHRPAVFEEMDQHALPVALGGIIPVHIQVLAVQKLKIFLHGHIFVFHDQCSPLLRPATRMRGSSTP